MPGKRVQFSRNIGERLGSFGGRPTKLKGDDLKAAKALLANPDIPVADVAKRIWVSSRHALPAFSGGAPDARGGGMMQLDMFPEALHLRCIDPAKNKRRFYTMAVEPTLFGEWTLRREWGRIGRGRRVRRDSSRAPAKRSMPSRNWRRRRGKGGIGEDGALLSAFVGLLSSLCVGCLPFLGEKVC